jgi:hypothetical protein
MIYSDHGVAGVEENDIDRKAHEEHMHPHERLDTAANEEHPLARFEACSPEQAATLARKTASILESRAQNGRAGLVKCAKDPCAHRAITKR